MQIHIEMLQKKQRWLTYTTEQGPGVAKHINIDKRAAIKHNKFYKSWLVSTCSTFQSYWEPSGAKYIYNEHNVI